MKLVTYITAVAALVFGLNTSNAATIEKSNVVIEAASGTVDARMDRQTGNISVTLKADEMQRAVIELTSSRGATIYKNIVVVDKDAISVDIDTSGFDGGVVTLTVKGKDLSHQQRFKIK